MQERQHEQEERFLEFLKNNYTQVWNSYEDVHEDFSSGIDIKLNDEPFDLKVSNSKRITIFKEHNGEWYSPLTLHPEVEYLYVAEYDKCYLLYRLKKSKIIEYLKRNPYISTYTGDGNVNICIELKMEDVMEDVYMLRKDIHA